MRYVFLIFAVLFSLNSFGQLQDSLLFSPDGKYAMVYDYNESFKNDFSLWNIYSSEPIDTVFTFIEEDGLYFEINYPSPKNSWNYVKTQLLNIDKTLEKFNLTVQGQEISDEIYYSISSKEHFTADSIPKENQFDITYFVYHKEVLLDSVTFEFFMEDSLKKSPLERLRPEKVFEEKTNLYKGFKHSTGFAMKNENGAVFSIIKAQLNHSSGPAVFPEMKTGEIVYAYTSVGYFEEYIILFN